MALYLENNYNFLTIAVKKLIERSLIPKKPVILDFGCGKCQLLSNLEKEIPNSRLYGVDIFRNSKLFKEINLKKNKFVIKDIKPYEEFNFNKEFDLIIANQVFEHIKDLDTIYKFLHSILAKDGKMIVAFPTKEILIEPHLKIPFIHWIKKYSKFQKLIIFCFNFLKFGNFKNFFFKKKEFENNIGRQIDFCNEKIFYLKNKDHIYLIKKYFPFFLNLSDTVNYFYRKGSTFNNFIRFIINRIPVKSFRLFLSSRLIGSIFLIYKNEENEKFKF